jgi:hypothetical protein
MGIAAGLVLSTLVTAIASDVLTPSVELAGFGGVCALAAALVWPIVGPLREIGALAGERFSYTYTWPS